ncbi:esterase-like activity of phytase family protein [Paenibacillus spongiae]|uniref:Esterase-like activity of phytase family protein n=1 Tax=Paenibacillus spongiae TaxID=2909671 RepID=A0ABY5SID9_9BACL|nr:esterase-like activity of phytase family protein [Paenibacillus spongiae]UVI33338.1 esterase-like activity of phytase family protein [Paenibacillus spongiae]
MKFVKLISIGVIAGLAVTANFDIAHAKQEKHGKHQEERTVGQLTFIGEQRFSNDTVYNETLVGGLSGIDYDSKTHKWIMISDDRSDKSPARYYTAKLKYDTDGFSSVKITGVTEFKQPDGTNYPNKTDYAANNKGIVPDFESIRFDPMSKSVWYTSEGDRNLAFNPFIRQASLQGKYLSAFRIPEAFKFVPSNTGEIQQGFRNNLALEGSSFSPDGKYYFTSMESSLYQDGDVSTVLSGSYSRITKYNRNGNILAEYAYPVDAIPAEPGPGKNADNGVSEMLAVNDHQFLILERSGVQATDGSYSNYIRIYEADIDQATNVKDLDSLTAGQFTPVSKRLVLNLNSLGLAKLDNIEGIAWGHKLKNGHDSLVLVSDNNFNASQVTQLLAFDVSPAGK